MAIIDELLADLTAQSAELDALVSAAGEAGWAAATPAEGWTVAHQIGHLLWTDRIAKVSATDPEAFGALVAQTLATVSDPATFVDAAAEQEVARPRGEVLAEWRQQRAELAAALAAVPAGVKLPWFGPPMSATSMATARLMETWAHGLDVADALGAELPTADRIKHVAHLGVRTRDFAYAVNGMQPPAGPFRVELTAPSGELWTWGPEDAANVVRGPAADFCALVTQRRHRDDLRLEVIGDDAQQWVGIAQAFAGPPGGGRAPLAERDPGRAGNDPIEGHDRSAGEDR